MLTWERSILIRRSIFSNAELPINKLMHVVGPGETAN